jgi:hypothetical protein
MILRLAFASRAHSCARAAPIEWPVTYRLAPGCAFRRVAIEAIMSGLSWLRLHISRKPACTFAPGAPGRDHMPRCFQNLCRNVGKSVWLF